MNVTIFGHFDAENSGYVTTRPDTPRAWSKYPIFAKLRLPVGYTERESRVLWKTGDCRHCPETS